MKARSDLTSKHTTVLSNPNNYYVDTLGRVNELETDDERILFGTVANPSAALRPTDELEELITVVGNPLDKLLANLYLDTHNPHLMAVDAVTDILENK